MTAREPDGPVLVTGAGGFVGGHLTSLLGQRAHTSNADVRDPDSLREEVRSTTPHAVVHLAALSAVAGSWRAAGDVWHVNAVGTVNLLDAVAAEAPAARVLVVSSGEVYGDTGERPAREDDAVRPSSPYAASKAAAELACALARNVDRLDVVVARAFAHTGPGQDERFAVGSWALQLARLERDGGGALKVGDLSAARDLLDVRDVCRAYGLLLGADVAAGVYNVATEHPVPMSEIVRLLVSLTACPVEVRPDAARQRRSDLRTLSGDVTKLRQATGWEPEVPLETTLEDALEHARAAVALEGQTR